MANNNNNFIKKIDQNELQFHPGLDAAKMIIASGADGGAIRMFADKAIMLLKGCDGTMGMTSEEYKLINKLIDDSPDACVSVERLLKLTDAFSENNTVMHVPTRSVPEFLPGKRPRGAGEKIELVDDEGNASVLEKYPAVYTADVLQTHPELLEKDVDQIHVVFCAEEKRTNKVASGIWPKLPPLDTDVYEVDGAKIIYKFSDENIMINLDQTLKSVLATDNTVVGFEKDGKIDSSPQAKRHVEKSVNDFERHGRFIGSSGLHRVFDAATPKVDGEPLFINVTDTKNFAVNRRGDRYSVVVKGRFEKEARKTRRLKMLVEFVPNIQTAEYVFLLQAWIFGVGNEIGKPFVDELMLHKAIFVQIEDRTLPLQNPNFVTVPRRFSDGLVLHKRNLQYFIKPVPTVDIKDQDTKDYLVKQLNVRVNWKEGLWEYAVDHDAKGIILKPLKRRLDKTRENSLYNILDVMQAPDFASWIRRLNEDDEDEVNGLQIPMSYFGIDDESDDDELDFYND